MTRSPKDLVRPVLVRGEGSYVWDRDGRRYLDATSGAFCVNFGYTAPELVAAMRRAAETLPFARASAFESEEGEAYRAALLAMAGPPFGRVVLTSSGSEAVEVAMKIAIAYQRAVGDPRRIGIRSLVGHFHGATLGALGVTGWEERRAAWAEVLGPRLDGLPEPDDGSAALIAETIPVAGAGVVVPPPGELARRRAACDAAAALWIADEVLTGFGRCGALFAWQRLAEWATGAGSDRADAGAIPDLVVFGKGAGAGFAALAGVLISERVAAALDAGARPFAHYQTYGGNPIACAVGRAVLTKLEAERWFDRVRSQEDSLRRAVEEAGSAVAVIGALAGFKPVDDATDYAARGVLVHGAADGRFVVAPPFPFGNSERDELRDALRATSPRGT